MFHVLIIVAWASLISCIPSIVQLLGPHPYQTLRVPKILVVERLYSPVPLISVSMEMETCCPASSVKDAQISTLRMLVNIIHVWRELWTYYADRDG